MTLSDLLLMLQQLGGAQNPGTQQSPNFAANQVGGQGVLGQGLTAQQQQMQQMLAGQQPQTLGAMAQQPMAQVPPQPQIRQGFTLLNPSDWTPQEHALFQALHGIKKQQSFTDQLKALLSGAMGSAQANQ